MNPSEVNRFNFNEPHARHLKTLKIQGKAPKNN